MPIAVIIDWYGPYDSREAFKGEMRCWASGTRAVYMALKAGNKVNYLGLTGTPATRFNNHPKFKNRENVRFFCGEIVSQGVSGKRLTRHKPDLSLAERALIARLRPPLNERLVESELTDCVVVYSRFFERDGETPHDPLPKFPRVIAYNGYSGNWDA
jgi:hypothetical protein